MRRPTTDLRGSMHDARKTRIWHARNGLCGECGKPVPMLGPEVRYDHRVPLWISRSDADSGIWPIHTKDCDETKTPADLSTIAKVKRIIRKADPATRPRSKRPMKGRGFQGWRNFKNEVVKKV